MKIFIAYSRADATDFARHVHSYLSNIGHDVFIDVNSIRIGDPWARSIEKNISECDIFVVILTPDALRSIYIEREVLEAQKQNKIIVPCMHKYVEYREIKWGLEKYQGITFNDKYELALKFSKIIKDQNSIGNIKHIDPKTADDTFPKQKKVKLFISYAREDYDFAKHVHKYLKGKGYAVLIDVNSIRVGDAWARSIKKNISECDIFVVILTSDSITSPNVEREVLEAQKQNKIIVPCMHEDVEYSEIKWGLEEMQGIEFLDEYKLARKLYSKIKTLNDDEI